MDDRTHRVLDGELQRTELTAAEAADLVAAEADIAAVLRTVPVATLPDLAPAVMRRIEEGSMRAPAYAESPGMAAPADAARNHGRPALARALEWIWKPRPISIGWRPVYGFAAAAVLVLLLAVGRSGASDSPVTRQVLTQFVLSAPDAQRVTLAGDFTDWRPAYELTNTERGVWTVVVPLDPGVHNYAFVVDGEQWVPDPGAPAVSDGFGGFNSRVAVLAPDASEL